MKTMRLFLLGMLCCLSGWTFAQRNIYFLEDFNVGQNSGTHALSDTWYVDSTTFRNYLYLTKTVSAGGEAPEATMGYYPSYGLTDVLSGTFQLISKPFTTQANPTYVTMKYSYRANKRSLKQNRSFGIVARQNGGEWQPCSMIDSLPMSIASSVMCARLPEAFENADNVQVALQLQSTKDAVNFYFTFDDVMFFSMPADWRSARVTMQSSVNVSGALDTLAIRIENIGAPIQESCTLSYRWDDGETYTHTYHVTSALGINEMAGAWWMPEGWDSTAYGTHVLEMWMSEIDGKAIGESDIEKATYVFNNVRESELFTKKILVEEFSSATCSPCAAWNSEVFNPAFENLGSDLVMVKYQMNWPGTGDKYYINEGGARKAYYGITGAPSMAVEGRVVDYSRYNATTFTQYLRQRVAQAGKTYYQIVFDELKMDSVSKTLHLTYHIDSKGLLLNAKVQTVIVERETTGNAGSNGETSFHHVTMAIVPGIGADGNTGLDVDFKIDTVYTFHYEVDMSATNMEECDDLMVACFIQAEDGTIAQAAMATEKASTANESPYEAMPLTIWPNPASEHVLLQDLQEATVEVVDLAGRRQFYQTGVSGDCRITVRDWTPGLYLIRVREGVRVATGRLSVVQ